LERGLKKPRILGPFMTNLLKRKEIKEVRERKKDLTNNWNISIQDTANREL
jgi:hypothetical protein